MSRNYPKIEKAFEALMITWVRVIIKAPKARRKEGWRIKRT